MAATKASRPLSRPHGTPDITEVRPRTRLPQTLPKTTRGLTFEAANRSSLRALSVVSPPPSADKPYDEEEDIETMLFKRSEPAAPMFAPPLPVPSLGGFGPPSRPTPRRSAQPTPLPAHVHLPSMGVSRSRRIAKASHAKLRGLAVLLVAAAIGAAIGWLVTPHYYGEPTSPAPASLSQP